MPHVSVHYKIYLPGGHHRQPRNTSAEVELNEPSSGDITGPYSPPYFPQLPYGANGAQMLFWSVTDGTNGYTHPPVQPPEQFTVPVGDMPLTITAWYFPIGGGNGNGNDTAIIDDAFSAIKGDFIDDTFVTVTSDASLTNQANVVGIVPTRKPETLEASATVASTTEPFSHWLSYDAGTPSGNRSQVPAGASGLAVAVYEVVAVKPTGIQHPHATSTVYGGVIGGIAVDTRGGIIINNVVHPVTPWGPLSVSLVRASLVSAASRGTPEKLGKDVRRLAAKAALQSIRAAIPQIEKAAETDIDE